MKRITIVLATCACALVAMSSTANAQAPIEGEWSAYDAPFNPPGKVRIEPDGVGGYRGIVTQAHTCANPVGQVFWQISGGGPVYPGVEKQVLADCENTGPGYQMMFRVVDDGAVANGKLLVCPGATAIDEAGNPTPADIYCNVWLRVRPPQTFPVGEVTQPVGSDRQRVGRTGVVKAGDVHCRDQADPARSIPCQLSAVMEIKIRRRGGFRARVINVTMPSVVGPNLSLPVGARHQNQIRQALQRDQAVRGTLTVNAVFLETTLYGVDSSTFAFRVVP